MKKLYAVWYREAGDTYDRVRGIALNWKRAEEMALSLEFYLQLEKKQVEVGVKTYIHGEMFLDPNQCENRWTKDEFETSEEHGVL